MVHLCAHRMVLRKSFINKLPADRADVLRRQDPFSVLFERRTVGAFVVCSTVWFHCHIITRGIKRASVLDTDAPCSIFTTNIIARVEVLLGVNFCFLSLVPESIE